MVVLDLPPPPPPNGSFATPAQYEYKFDVPHVGI